MNRDQFVTLFGSPAAGDVEGNNDLEAARAEGFLKLRSPKPVSDDEAQATERDQQDALLISIISLL